MISLAPTLAPPTPEYLYALLAVVSDPARAKQHLDALAAAQAAIVAEQAKLADLETRAAAIGKDRASFESERTVEQGRLAERAAELDRQQAALADQSEQLAVARQEHAAAADALKKSQADHAAQLAHLERLRVSLRS